MPSMPAGIGFIPIDGTGGTINISMESGEKLFEAARRCAPLAAIVSSMADAFVAGKFEVLNRQTGNFTRGAYKEWDRLLEKPNRFQSRKHFFKQLYISVKVVGYCFVLKHYPTGFKDRPSELYVLPPECIQLVKKRYSVSPTSFTNVLDLYDVVFTWGGEQTKLDNESLMLIKDSTPVDKETLMPTSRLINLRYPVSNLIAAYEARCTLIQKRGALGILSNSGKDSVGTIPIQDEERREVQGQFYSNYGLTRGQSQVVITTAALQWQQMSMNVKDLMLMEEHLSDVKDVCDAFGYPFPLSSHSDQSTYNNVSTADRLLYQNSIIPDSEDYIDEQFNEGLKTPESNIRIVINYENVPALQASAKERGEGMKALNDALKIEWDNGLITRNIWLESLGKDTVNREEFNKYKFEVQQQQFNENGENIPSEDQGTAAAS